VPPPSPPRELCLACPRPLLSGAIDKPGIDVENDGDPKSEIEAEEAGNGGQVFLDAAAAEEEVFLLLPTTVPPARVPLPVLPLLVDSGPSDPGGSNGRSSSILIPVDDDPKLLPAMMEPSAVAAVKGILPLSFAPPPENAEEEEAEALRLVTGL
jgi:hypothetical protein